VCFMTHPAMADKLVTGWERVRLSARLGGTD
jgi:hypothetical protein